LDGTHREPYGNAFVAAPVVNSKLVTGAAGFISGQNYNGAKRGASRL
jgi:hypothetical protein